MAWTIEATISIIALVLTGIGILVALVYNYFATKQQSRMQLYQIMKDLEDRFHKIEVTDFPIGTDYDYRNYFTSLLNFATFMANLEKLKMIDAELLLISYRYNFEIALWIKKHALNTAYPENLDNFDKLCKDNNIVEVEPHEERLPKDKFETIDFDELKDSEKEKDT